MCTHTKTAQKYQADSALQKYQADSALRCSK